MKFTGISFIFIAASLAACASNPTFPLSRPSSQQQAEVLIYRESSIIAAGVTLTVGVNGRAVANMSNNEKVRALLPAGAHEIYVQARSAAPTKINVKLEPGTSACFRAIASTSTLAKGLVPIVLMASGYEFNLGQVACPEKAYLDKYKEQPVSYQ